MPKRILLADDSVTIQKVISITFSSEDFDIEIVGDGESAIRKAKELKPDLVMADVAMPGKDGYQVCTEIKSDPELSGTPVMLLAGTFEPLDAEKAKGAGADEHIIKPFESQELLDKVNALVSRPAAPSAETEPAAEVPEGEFGDMLDEKDFVALSEEFEEAPGTEAGADADLLDQSFFEPGADQEEAKEDFVDLEFSDNELEAAPGAEPLPEEPQAEEPEIKPFGAEEETSEPAAALEPQEAGPAQEESFEPFGGAELEDEPIDFGSFREAPSAPQPQEAEEEPAFGGPEDVIEAPAEAAPEPEAPSLDAFREDFSEEPAEAHEEAREEAREEAFEPAEAAPEAQPVEETPFQEPVEAFTPQAEEAAPAAPDLGEAAGRVEERAAPEVAEELQGRVDIPLEEVQEVVARVAREVVEKVAWEVVPELAEEKIEAELKKIREAFTKLK